MKTKISWMTRCRFYSKANSRRTFLTCCRFQNQQIRVKIKLSSKAYNHSRLVREVKSKKIILNLSSNSTMRERIQTSWQLACAIFSANYSWDALLKSSVVATSSLQLSWRGSRQVMRAARSKASDMPFKIHQINNNWSSCRLNTVSIQFNRRKH